MEIGRRGTTDNHINIRKKSDCEYHKRFLMFTVIEIRTGMTGENEEIIMDENYTIAVAGTGYVGLSIATLLSQHHKVFAVDIIPEKVEKINKRVSPIQDEYIEKYLAEKELDLTATLDAEMAYRAADFVVIAAPTNVYSTNRIDVATSKRACFAHYMGH